MSLHKNALQYDNMNNMKKYSAVILYIWMSLHKNALQYDNMNNMKFKLNWKNKLIFYTYECLCIRMHSNMTKWTDYMTNCHIDCRPSIPPSCYHFYNIVTYIKLHITSELFWSGAWSDQMKKALMNVRSLYYIKYL